MQFRHDVLIRRALLFLVIVLVCLSSAPFVVNHSGIHDLLVQYLRTQVGLEVSTLKVQLLPTASIDVSGVVLRDSFTAEPTLRARHAAVSLRLWPLMTKRVLMLTITAIEPEVMIRRDMDGHWQIPSLVDSKHRANDSDFPWSVTNLVLRDGTLRIVDPRLKSEGIAIAIHHIQAILNTDRSEDRAEVLLRGRTNDGGDLRLAGTFGISESDAGKRTLNKQFNGTVYFYNWNLPYWLERTVGYAVAYEATAERGTLSASVRADFPEYGDGFHVIVSDVRADTGWLAISGDILITDAGTEHPAYVLALSAAPVNSHTLLAHIPLSWVPEQVQTAIDDYEAAGTIEIDSVLLRGRMDIPRVPDEWRITANVVDASGRFRNGMAFISNLSGSVALDSKHAELTNLSGEVNGVQVRSDKLGISDMDLFPTLDGKFEAYGEVEKVAVALRGLGQGTDVHRLMQSLTNPTGYVRAAIHLAGSLRPDPSLEVISAAITIENVGATFNNGVSIRAINGVIEANSHVLTVNKVSGVFQGIHFEAQGKMDLNSNTRINDLHVAMSSDGAAVQNVVTAYLPAATGLSIDGIVSSSVLLSGTPAAMHCRGTIDVTQAEVRLPSVVHKKKGVRGLVEWQAKLFDRTRLLVDRLFLALSHSEIRAAGQTDISQNPKFRWHIQGGPLSLRDLAQSGAQIPMIEGIVQTSAAVTGEGTNWKEWMPSGSVIIRRGVISLPGHTEQLVDVQGRVRLTPEGVHFDSVSFRMGEADINMTGTIEHWRSHPRARIMVESSQLNVSTFMRETTNSWPTSMNFQDWLQLQETTIAVVVKQLRYEELLFKTVSGEVRVNGEHASLNELRAQTPKGMMAGHIEARLARRDRIDVAAHLSVDGIPAEHLLPAGKKEHLQGDVSMAGMLRARIDPQLPLTSTLSTGHDGIILKITSGRVQEDLVLTKVLKILNLPAILFGQVDFAQDGIPFHSLSARVIASNGVLSSQDIVLDSPVIKVAGAGSADIRENDLDLALAVSPVASYSDLFAQIPLLRPLGDHSGLTTAVFQATGSLFNPEVAYLPVASFARGMSGYPRMALDVLTRAITLPPAALASLAE